MDVEIFAREGFFYFHFLRRRTTRWGRGGTVPGMRHVDYHEGKCYNAAPRNIIHSTGICKSTFIWFY